MPHWDDTSLNNAELVFRRIPTGVSNCIAQDKITGVSKPAPGAFKYDFPSGVSVQIESLMQDLNITIRELCNWSTHIMGQFSVGDVRTTSNGGAGVVPAPDPDDPVLGAVHGAVRVPASNAKAAMRAWRSFRHELMDCVTLIEVAPVADVVEGP